MEVYHKRPTSLHYPYVPPIARLLKAIRDYSDDDGMVMVTTWKLAEAIGYSSADTIAPLLAQLTKDGWITYDARMGATFLLIDPESEPDLYPDEILGYLLSLPRQI